MSYTEAYKDRLKCNLCPHGCIISDGRTGVCMVRMNEGGELSLPFYGRLSAVSTDPIEKKPLYHFYPGSSIFSVGFYGCSFRCPFCQNFRIAHSTPSGGSRIEPEDLVETAMREGASSIAYTYSEPLIHFEWILETSKIAHKRGLSNVLVSNGYINREPAEELLPHIDAANIDLKSFRNDYYTKVIGGRVQPVLDFIALAARDTHVEVTTLVIPEETDSEEEISDIAGFLAELNPDMPYHLSAYYPTYKYTKRPTSPQKVLRLVDVAKRHLNHVYPGNVGTPEVSTECASCGNVLVLRRGYGVSLPGIERDKPGHAHCSSCNAPVPFPV